MVINDRALRITFGLSIIIVTALVYFFVFPGPLESHTKLVAYVASFIIGIVVLLSAWIPEK